MSSINQLLTRRYLFYIFIFSFLIFSFKWVLSYIYFSDDLTLKIIFDTPSDGYMYYAHLKALSSGNLSNSYDFNYTNLKNISLPYAALLFPSILYLLTGAFSILIIEYLFIFFYILIFFLLFRQLDFKFLNALCLSLFVIILPSLLEILNIDNITYISSLNQFFNLRFPRPFLINFFYFFFIFFLINLSKKKIYSYKNFIIVILILSYSLS